ncbi:hypothetical protein LOTGIDRAFT_230254 [Lottia gigantea]|uniref:VWFA domain-containing protein n=1 Tax=Lottia gigantea TaxID=225164 RepID=V4B9C8_LOTGI|nr:hypothetical protein LOTGIDRAFT_230254 [Lottia gigantea]ESP03976.1 hypothetical protein LOTGIDRAFT_230254 [Lottia gigantea]
MVSTLPSSSLYILVHVHNFCNNLENVLTSVLIDMESDVQITWFWNNLPYIVYFLSVVKNLKSYPESVFLSRLSLHWNWLYNKLLLPLLSSSSTWRPPSVILSSINQLQNIMGQENMAAKQFVRYLTQYGHPKPYTTQSQSELQQDMRYCQDCLNIYKNNKPAVLKLKVEALVHDGEKLKCLLQSICESFYNGHSDKENEDGIQMKIGKLKCSLIERNILEEEFESMDTRESADTSGTAAKPTRLKQYVELWPIYEHFSLLFEYYLMVNERPELTVHQLRDLITRYTPSTTNHLLDNPDAVDKKKLYLLLSEVIMNKLWRSSVTKDSTTWLLWNTQLPPPDDTTKIRFRGPGIFHLIPMSYSIYTLLSTKSPDPKDNSYLPLHVSLGSVDDQLNKLHQLSSYLWKYSGVLSSTRLNIGNIEQGHLMKSFIKMLDSFGVLLTSHSQTKWFELISTVEMNYSTGTLTTGDILTVQAYYQEVYTTIEHPALPLVSRCFEVVIDILQNCTGNGLGLGLAYVGLASVYLLAPVGPVDPVEKNAIKMKNFENQIKEIECEIEVYESNIRLKTGLSIEDIKTSKLHPRLQYLIERKQHLQHKILLLTDQQAYRPDPLQYLSLVQDVKAYLESIGSIERVTALLSKLQTANQIEGGPHVDEVIITSCLREEEAWQQTQQSFLDSLDKHYWCYPDLIIPFKALIQQMRLGVSILTQTVETSHKQFTLSKQIYGQSLEEVMLILSQFPNISQNHETFHDLTKILIYDTTCELVNTSISTQNTDSDHIHDVLSKLLLCGLYLIKIHCINSGELTSHITQTLSNLFTTFVTAWQDQETRRREKEAEDASLYRYRSKNHGDEKTDEDKDEAEFKSSFPSFENVYADLVGPQSLEEVGNLTEEDESIKSTPYSISIEDMYTVYQIHDLLFTSLITTDWLPSVSYTKPTIHDYIQPAIIAYNIASQVATKSPEALGRDVDTGVVGGHLLISGVVQQTILSGLNNTQSQTENSLCLKPTEYYDIYYDSNVNEVSQCKVILDRFLVRLDELLIEYPQHPTLSQIVAIIRRILSFSITCPIMKFLVGLELLLEKTKDWEANAAKHVSVMTHFKEVSAMVVQWRKLELGCWKNTMLIEERKCEKSVSKWWFHLYQLITSYLHNATNTQETVESEKLVTSLKEFLEKSNLGEFKYRLKMILAFHCQVYKMDASDKQVEVLNLLWNLYQFYLQYLPNIEAEITSQKTPLLKQLKGFVKIARWSDLNYWALKQSTEKTHRTVHKYSKKYQMVLNQPITKLLGEKGDNLSMMTSGSGALSKGGVLCDRLEVYRQTVYTQKLRHDKSEVDDKTLSSLQQRLPILIPKLCKHWKTVVKSLPYTQTLKGLDEFTGDVIETVHELQQAEVSTGDDKEKQKSAAKFLNLRKRKSLAELFKYLTKMGLSYRKGLILDDLTKQDNSLSLQPLDITVAKSHYQLSEVLASQWENCQNYFYRCITRKAQLEQAVIQPAQDLGLGNVERCRGFSHHLHHLFTQQRHELGETFTSFLQIRKFTNEIKRLKKEDGFSLPSQFQVQYWLGRVKNLCIQLLEGLNQYNILLQSCPTPSTSTSILPDITQLSPLSNIKYGDTMWLQTSEKIQSIISRTETEYKKLMKLSQKHFLLWEDVKLIEGTSQKVKNFSDTLTEITVLFTDPIDNTDCALNTPLNILIGSITNCIGEVEEWAGQSRDRTDSEAESSDMMDNGEESGVMIDSLIETVLLVVQKLLSKHPVVEKKTEEEEEEEELEDGYIVKGLLENLKFDITEIKTKQISTMIMSIIEKTMLYFENEDTVSNGETSMKLLLRCLPLLERYCDITEYFLAHVICSHRCCGKLLSVLLALFTELAMKGFCVPPELSDEMEQEGATEFKDIEQGGLGEGEGVKDVSDQIETEDQLDDTRRAGEEKKEDNDHQDIPAEDNAIEMSEDFEGKPQDMNQEEEEDKDKNDDDNDDDDELDKEMGDIEDQETDKLDEQLWGSDEEEDNESDEKPKEETGPGDGEKEESELVAKDDNLDKSQDKDDKQNDKQQGEEEEQKDEINEMDDIEEEGYNDDKIDANQGDSKEPEAQPETMDLPEDLNLDAEEAGEKEEETEMDDPAEGKEDGNEDEEGTEDVDKLKDKEEKEEEGKDENQESEKNDANEDGAEEEEKKEENGGEENKDNDNEEREDDEGQGDAGFTADDEKIEEEEDKGIEEEKNDKMDTQGQTQHDDTNIENSDTAQDQASQADNEQQEKVGSGMADTQQDDGHEGEQSSEVTQGSNEKKKEMKRQPGKSREDRSLGSPDQSYQRLKTTEETHPEDEEEESGQEKKEGELYEHIKDSKSHHDAQTLDVANDDTEEQMIPNKDQEEVKDDDDEPMEDVKPLDDEVDNKEQEEEIEKKEANKVKGKKLANDKMEDMKIDQDEEMEEREKVEISGERILTMTANRGPTSTIHTAVEHLHMDNGPSEIDVEKIRADLEENVNLWSHQSLTTPEQMVEASSAWQRYEAITSGLSQELCEQLRLILEPSQATQLKGDYRTGKRLNMRKVIPYIASQFRKDKIWLRRSKPSKRQYQIMLAIDDSSSMLDNHSKQLAFESLALISNALTLLEAGDLAVTSFGESVKVLHSFTDQFSSQSGANILHQFTFEQKKTKIAQLLQQATSLMIDGRSRQHGIVGNPETSQLLLIVSDGRGLFSEGMEAVKSAVRKAREANIFLVFVIIDNPENKDSILDIRVPIFKGPGKLPEIKSYMEQFPFPFYIILRDINSLPITLSDALRQWFELVTAADR